MLTGIILASGFSRRFNGDKLTFIEVMKYMKC